ncbi:MAG: hypothetical protein M1817_004205 [Caeruleum heppii]|nr:MAG: hypothetical protein M1817_004205 [Caeruleum heppii]
MAAQALPGRPGNLTMEQDTKLREFWYAVMSVFGVLYNREESDAPGDPLTPAHDEIPHPVAEKTPNGRSRAETVGSEKKRKKRLNLFGRKTAKHDDVDSTAGDGSISVSGHGATAATSDTEDKYGQNHDFKLALASQTPESLRAAFWSMVKSDHPDALLLRFLRARKWDVERALVMLVATMHWRSQEMLVDDDIIKTGEAGALQAASSNDPILQKDGQDFLAQMRLGKSYLHGVDGEGRPICWVHVRLHRQGEQSEKSLERYTVFVIETARLLLRSPVDTAAIVFDMSGFSMANMDYAPVKFMIKCFEANYPESLGVVLVHKSPWIFQGIWSIIKGWLDPVVAGKVHFTKSVEDLQSFIPRSHIMKELGGEEDWSYKYIEPSPGENAKMADDATKERLLSQRRELYEQFEARTMTWITASVDDSASNRLKDERENLARSLRENYWILDPHLRARSLYDRCGVIQAGGHLNFYRHESVKQGPPPAPAAVETSTTDLD